MLRTIGEALDFLRVGDSAKQSKSHTPFGGVGLSHNKSVYRGDKLVNASVIRQRGNIAHAGENMLRAIGETLDFLRVGDAAKQSKSHTPFGGVGLKFITNQQAAVINL